MKKTTTITLLFAAITIYALYIGCGQGAPDASKSSAPKANVLVAGMPSRLPQDAMQSCTLSQAEFNSWFASGTASENGLVQPANSVTFGHNNNCDFYQWSWQMFAWLVSPTPGGITVMESPVFYTVSPVDSIDQRVLIPHEKGTLLKAMNHIGQEGPNKLPMIRDKQGNLFEVEKHAPNVKPMLLTKTSVHKVEMNTAGKPVFMDQAGKTIPNPKALIQTKGNTKNIVQEFKTTSGKSVFLTSNGFIIDSEEGQATGDGLIAQNGSLVYYITMVNDVYAFYLSGAKNKQLSSIEFPTTAAQRDSICAIARANGVTLPDSNALAIEIKSSWIDVTNLPDPEKYVTIEAMIPTYDTSNPAMWVPTGEKKATLALLGVHVVGSTAGHPELVWSTFEHQRNTPNASYQYLDTNKAVKTVLRDSSGHWTLSSNALDPKPNVSHISVHGDTLKANSGFTISASNCSQVFPWGTQANVSPNAEDGSSAASNSEIISINNSIFGWLVGNDIRKNYMLVGATWTSGGAAPSGKSYSTNPSDPGAAIGTSLLANSTMETYFQGPKFTCFTCHHDQSKPSVLPGQLSHVYTKLQPLPNFKIIPSK